MTKYNRLLLRFDHGLGDCAQFTGVVKHLLNTGYANHISIATKDQGKQTLFRWLDGWVEHPTLYKNEQFDHVMNVRWAECSKAYENAPSTKAVQCLETEFHIQPVSVPAYIPVSDQRAAEMSWIIEKIPKPYVVMHYEGNTASGRKNMPHHLALRVIQAAARQNMHIVILDWDYRSPHIQRDDVIHFDPNHPIWKSIGTGDGESIRYLVDNARLFVGIDSGPFHVAASSNTKTIGLWSGMHPIHYCDLTPNTEHLLRPGHENNVRGQRELALDFFEKNYTYKVTPHFAEEIEIAMSEPDNNDTVKVSPNETFLIRRKLAGQDLLIFNDIVREDSYRAWILGTPHRSGPQVVVDVGAHIGTFAYLWKHVNPEATIHCIEACPENVEILRQNVEQFAKVYHAACTYEEGRLYLLNTVIPGKSTTGGSIVITEDEQRDTYDSEYHFDERPLTRITLEDIASEIDILKLDCEGCEFSLLEKCPNIDRIGLIVGEYHDRSRWHDLLRRKFSDWPYSEGRSATLGTFHLRNPRWTGCWATQR